ncbi:MAG: ABC transporter ATP-binding protein/permease [Clostridia bacterium]|nr:ABC transporter ATP-binding protein/permease [Clostridia bacterium]
MKMMFGFFKGKTIQTILAPTFKMIEAIFELLVPIVVANIIDIGIANQDTKYIVTWSIILFVFGIVGFLFCITAQYFSSLSAGHYAYKIKKAMIEKTKSLSFADIDRIGTGQIVTLVSNDADRTQNAVNMTLRLLLRSPFIVFGAVICAYFVDIIGASVLLVAVAVLFLVVFIIIIFGAKLYKQSQTKLDEITVQTRENVLGTRVIRAFAKEEEIINKFKDTNNEYAKTQLKAGKISALMNPFTYVIINAALILILHFSGIRVNAGQLTQGQSIALYNYLSQILIELIKFANLTITVSRGLASGKRVAEFLRIKPSQEYVEKTEENTNLNESPVLEFSNVSISYNGAGNALENINFTLNKGETLGIVGGTGSGKSTLCNLIPRFYDSTEGTIRINNIDVKKYSKEDLISKVSYVMQKNVILSGSIKENIEFGQESNGVALEEAVDKSQSRDIINSKKDGLEEKLNKGGTNLSGGQKQRISIARALYKNSDILILDDSYSALDNITANALRKEIKQLGKTVVVVSQRTNNVMYADKILVLDQGKCVGYGTHEELLKNCKEYIDIFNSQEGVEDEKHK